MRISVKGRYALAAVMEVGRQFGSGENVAVITIAEALGISKIYLEQVFAQLKKAKLLLSVKGSKGGYQLSKPPTQITSWDVLSAIETALSEETQPTVEENAPGIETAMQTLVFRPLDNSVKELLSSVSVQDLLDYGISQEAEQAFMLNM